MATRWARVVRGLVAAVVASLVAGLAHVAGGGAAPSVAGSALVLALCIPIGVLLAGRTLSTVRLGVAVTVSQAAFHALFLLTGASSAAIVVHAATGMHSMRGATEMAPMGDASSVKSGLTTAVESQHWMTDSGMWVAHLIAAAVTILALRFGEGAFWALLEIARVALERFGLVATVILTHGSSAVLTFTAEPEPRRPLFLRAGLRHRGPPSSVVALA